MIRHYRARKLLNSDFRPTFRDIAESVAIGAVRSVV
jgi:hypothetical protein